LFSEAEFTVELNISIIALHQIIVDLPGLCVVINYIGLTILANVRRAELEFKITLK